MASRRIRLTKKTSLPVLIVIVLVALAQQYGWLRNDPPPPQVQSAVTQGQSGAYQVTGFTDGDTITVSINGKAEKVRFIGVDTPEIHDPRKEVQCFGEAAAQFTKQLIGNTMVRLETDPENNDRDRYGRLLRYVYLPDNRLVNAEIIQQGYGFAYLSFPFTKSDEFRALETEARQNKRGLWDSCQPAQNQQGSFTSNNIP